jgi:hypothetical protein
MRELRSVRSVVGEGYAHHSDNYNEAKTRYETALLQLMDAMEQDLETIR